MNADYEKIMENWEKALESYETPGDFADRAKIHLFKNSGDISLRVIVSPGFASRAKLMENQKQQSEKRKAENLPSRWRNDGNLCFLCDNVSQAEDIGSNLMLPWNAFENYILVPNRYPMIRGHFLLCAKNHNLSGMQPGLIQDYLATMSQIAEKYNLLFVRNHPRAGMSIPEHEHGHFHPAKIEKMSGRISLNGLAAQSLIPAKFGEGIYFVEKTRFDTLALTGKKSLEYMARLIGIFAEKKIIFTFGYEPHGKKDISNGKFFLTPHRIEEKTAASGAALYIKSVNSIEEMPSYEDCLGFYEKYIFTKGNFSWENYF